jgi:5''-3'' exonuclease (including N-terminal domain of PolI)
MGIDGLLSFLKPTIKYGHISNFANKTAAVDVMAWLYRGAYSCALELATKQPTNNYLIFVYKMIQLLKKWNVKPILCIDGRYLVAKERTNEFRAKKKVYEKEKGLKLFNEGHIEEAKKTFTRSIKITKKMIYRLIDMLRAMNVDYLIAPYEADAQVSFLCKNGHADIAISEDSDLLCYNCPTVLFKLSVFGECEYITLDELRAKRKNKEKLQNSSLDTLFSLSEENFTYVCILAGCDYLPSVKGMGIKKAINFFERFGNIDSVIRRLRIESKFMGKVPDEYEKTVKRVAMIFLYQLIYDPSTKKLTTLHPRDDFEEFVNENKYFIGEVIPDIEKFVIGKLNLKTLEEREFGEFDLQALIGHNKGLQNLDQAPSTQDIIKRTMIQIKNEQKFSQQTSNYHKSQQKSSVPKLTVTQPEEKRPASPNFVDLDDFNFNEFDYDFQDYEEKKDSDEDKPKIDPTRQMNLSGAGDGLDKQIDFLFLICKEYSRGMEDMKKSDSDQVPKSPNKSVSEKKSPFVKKPNSTFKTYLDVELESQVVQPPSTALPVTIVMEEEDSMIDSFRKLKALGNSAKKTPINREKENTKVQSNSSTPNNITPAKKNEGKSSTKRKLIEIEKEKESPAIKENQKTDSTKKTKVTPTEMSNQPKISLFFQKNKN